MECLLSNLNVIFPGLPLSNYENKQLWTCIWIALTFFSYFVGYIYLSKFAKACLIHEAIPQINKTRIIRGLWRLTFSVWIIVIFFLNTSRNLKPDHLDYGFLQAVTTFHCNLTSFQPTRKEDTPLDNALVTAPAAFFLHQLYISLTDSSEPAIVTMTCLALFVLSADSLECHWLSLQILFILALNVGTMELAKIFYALKSRYRGYDGPPAPNFLRVFSPPLFALHIIVWIMINFYIFPTLVFSLPSVTEVDPQYRLATIFINIFLIFFAKEQFFCSPEWSLLKLLVTKPNETSRILNIQSLPSLVLLPYSGTLVTELRTIQLAYLCEALPTSSERRMLRKKMLSSGKQATPSEEPRKFSSGQAPELLSIVKCVSMLKRKMRHRYELKNASEASCHEVNSEMENSSNEHSGEAATDTSEADEINDIFITVPTTLYAVGSSEGAEGSSQGRIEVTADVHSPATHQEKEEVAAGSGESNIADTALSEDYQHDCYEAEN